MFFNSIYTTAQIGSTEAFDYSGATDSIYYGSVSRFGTAVGSVGSANVQIAPKGEPNFPLLFGVQVTTPCRFRQRSVNLNRANGNDPKSWMVGQAGFSTVNDHFPLASGWTSLPAGLGQRSYFWLYTNVSVYDTFNPPGDAYPGDPYPTTPYVFDYTLVDTTNGSNGDMGMLLTPGVLYPIIVKSYRDAWWQLIPRGATSSRGVATTAGVLFITAMDSRIQA